MPKYLLGLLLIGMLFVSGCPPIYPYLDQHTYTKPNQADLVGVWEPDSNTLEEMRTQGGYKISKHQIILNADGTGSIINMPDSVFNDGRSWKTFKSGPIKWKIDDFGDIDGKNIWGVSFDSSNTAKIADFGAYLFNQELPYNIVFILGDPDAGDIVVYEKK